MTYLQRYLDGERVEVWRELVAFGDAVRQESLYSDAKAVADETMRRARHNIDLLLERLRKLGYSFRYPQRAFVPPTKEAIRNLNKFEKKVGPVPLSMRAWVEIVGQVDWSGSYPRLSYYHHESSMTGNIVMKAMQTGSMDTPDLLSIISQLKLPPGAKFDDAMMAKLKEQVNAMLGRRNAFFDAFPDMAAKLQTAKINNQPDPPPMDIPEAERLISDPLVVDFSEIDVDSYEDWHEMVEMDPDSDEYGSFFVTFAPDIHHKANYSGGGGYEILLPDARADGFIVDYQRKTPLVEYLRETFAWAGFPGLKDYDAKVRDDALLDRLREGLLPL